MTWILPRQLLTSPFVLDTGALILDCAESSEVCARSLLVRSKPLPSQIWSRKWKRDSWTRHLSGRMLKPSLGPLFEALWTSCLVDTRASLSAPPESDAAKTIPATCGRTSQGEFDFASPPSASSRTSRGTFRWDSPQSSAIWRRWVTERRGAYSARLKSARLTSASESSSWPTASARDWKDSSGMSSTGTNPDGTMRTRTDQLARAVYAQHGLSGPESGSTGGSLPACWPTPEGMSGGKTSRGGSRKGELLLSGMVKMWPTATTDASTERTEKYAQGGMPLTAAVKMWPTPNTCPEAPNNSTNRGNGVHRNRNTTQCLGEAAKQWATPRAQIANGPDNCPNKQGAVSLQTQVASWPSPAASTGEGGSHGLDGGTGARSMLPPEMRNSSGKLNPRWVETLMGVPIGWTCPSCTSPQTIARTNSGYSATALCPTPLHEHSSHFGGN